MRSIKTPRAFAATMAYSFCSVSIIFSQKIILGTYGFPCNVGLVMIQNICSLLMLKFLAYMGKIELEPLKLNIIKSWIPLNIILVIMLISSTFSLKFLSVAMVTIFKNIQTICVALGDFIYFKEPLGTGSAFGIFVMFVGSLISGYNDLEFNVQGYAWILLNCLSGAAYVLYMKFAMLSTTLSTTSSAYYNNVLSIPALLLIVIGNQEIYKLFDTETWSSYSTDFWITFVFNITVGASMSFVSLWMVAETSPTTYSIVGAVNKLPLSVLSIWWFNTEFTKIGGLSGLGALLGSIVYSFTKPAKKDQKKFKDDEKLPV